jgi:diaminopimelate epimerase
MVVEQPVGGSTAAARIRESSGFIDASGYSTSLFGEGTMRFAKMEGCANDFVLTRDVPADAVGSLCRAAPALCDRRRGIGADGIIAVVPSSTADFGMRIVNADGSEAEMCGNGIRCFALYVRRTGLSDASHLSVETGAGLIQTEIVDEERVKVNMGAPVLDAQRIPTTGDGPRVVNEQLTVDDRVFGVTAVSMGNPHAVVYADNLSDELVLGYGPKLESHRFFPNKANVEFVAVRNAGEVDMRVFERGVGETLACGTGACAAAVSGVLGGRHGNEVTVHLRGGDLEIQWAGEPSQPVLMTGPARWVYEGSIDRP